MEYHLVINISKSLFGHASIDFLGHHITHDCIVLLPNKVDAISHFQPKETAKGLQEPVKKANFFPRFIPAAAQIMSPLSEAPLFEALAGKPRVLVWNDVGMKALKTPRKHWWKQYYSIILCPHN